MEFPKRKVGRPSNKNYPQIASEIQSIGKTQALLNAGYSQSFAKRSLKDVCNEIPSLKAAVEAIAPQLLKGEELKTAVRAHLQAGLVSNFGTMDGLRFSEQIAKMEGFFTPETQVNVMQYVNALPGDFRFEPEV